MSAIFAVAGLAPERSRRSLQAMMDRTLWSRGTASIQIGESGSVAAFGSAREPDAPIYSDQRFAVVFDGRIDNLEELRHILALPKDVGAAQCLLAAHLRWGRLSATWVRGEFAYIIRDDLERRLTLVRDRIGVRSLYYSENQGEFRVASCADALFEPGFLDPVADDDQLLLVMTRQYTGTGATYFRNLRSLEPGCVGVVHNGCWQSYRYYRLEPRERTLPTERAYVEAYRERLERAVSRRAKGRCAVLVSGGLDSSTVAAVVASQCRKQGQPAPLLLTMRYPGLPCDEQPYSDLLASHLGSPIVTTNCVGDMGRYELHFPPTITDLEPSFVPLGDLYRHSISQGVDTILTGHGSDDTQQGTGWEVPDALAQGNVRRALMAAGIWSEPQSRRAWQELVRGAKLLVPENVRALQRRLRGHSARPPAYLTTEASQRLNLLRQQRAARLAKATSARARIVDHICNGSAVSAALAFDSELAGRIGVHVEHPFFDVDVIEFVVGLPNHYRFAPELGKPLLRLVAEPLLPKRLAWRRGAAEATAFLVQVVNAQREGIRWMFGHSELSRRGLVQSEACMDLIARATTSEPTAMVEAGLLILAELLARWKPVGPAPQ